MIKLNIIIFKIINYHNTFIYLKKNIKKVNFFKNSSFFFNFLLIFNKTYNNFSIFNNFFLMNLKKNFYYFYYFYYFYNFSILKKKIILFNKVYLNNFKKNNYLFTSFLNNFYSNNYSFFYKFHNNFYLKKNYYKKKNFSNKNNFFLFKKKENNLINSNFFLNFNFFKKKSKFLSKKLSNRNVFFLNFNNSLYSNFFFYKFNKFTDFKTKPIILKYKNCVFSPKVVLIVDYYNNVNFYKFFNLAFKKVFLYNNYKKFSFNPNANNLIIDLNLFKSKRNFLLPSDINFFKIEIKELISNLKVLVFIKISHYLNNTLSNVSVFLPLYFFFKNYKFIFRKKLNIIFIKKRLKYFRYLKIVFKSFKNLIYLNDFYGNNTFLSNFNCLLLSNQFFFKNIKILDDFLLNDYFNNKEKKYNNISKINYFNNYYPIFYANNISKNFFFNKFKLSLNVNFLTYIQFFIISFLEKFFKKSFFLKITNNFFQKNTSLNSLFFIYDNYKNFQPKYMKNFLIRDFIELIWYSFFLRDLTLLSDWVCKFMEFVNFKVHKKFIIFFKNFIEKNSQIFFKVFNIKGFFFDIRGKVGVTGNSKKRHFFFKIGKLNKSTKINKINFKQSVVRTPSGALGLTFIINY